MMKIYNGVMRMEKGYLYEPPSPEFPKRGCLGFGNKHSFGWNYDPAQSGRPLIMTRPLTIVKSVMISTPVSLHNIRYRTS